MDERTTLLVRTHLDSVSIVDEYQKLQAENEKLKGELKQTEVQDQVVIDGLRNENAKLKCLALHAMSEYFYLKAETYTDIEVEKYLKVMMWATKSRKAYRKAKKALREGKYE